MRCGWWNVVSGCDNEDHIIIIILMVCIAIIIVKAIIFKIAFLL